MNKAGLNTSANPVVHAISISFFWMVCLRYMFVTVFSFLKSTHTTLKGTLKFTRVKSPSSAGGTHRDFVFKCGIGASCLVHSWHSATMSRCRVVSCVSKRNKWVLIYSFWYFDYVSLDYWIIILRNVRVSDGWKNKFYCRVLDTNRFGWERWVFPPLLMLLLVFFSAENSCACVFQIFHFFSILRLFSYGNKYFISAFWEHIPSEDTTCRRGNLQKPCKDFKLSTVHVRWFQQFY